MRALLSTLCCLILVCVKSQPHLPKFYLTAWDTASKGYYFFTTMQIGKNGARSGATDVIIDSKANPVYVKEFESGFIGGNLQLHSNGCYSYLFNNKFYVLDSLFRPLDTVFCQNGLIQDSYDFLILPNGNYALLGYETSTMNLSKYFFFKKNGTQGLENSKVRCGVIQELDKKKQVVFEWHSKEHYQFDDIDTFYVDRMYDIDWTHFNALEYDRDGNYLVSSKHFNEITKVNRSTGEIIWRLGGKRNQFAFLDDSLRFKGQHAIKRLPNRHITLFDNGSAGDPIHPEGAKEYRLDERNLSVTIIWSHVNNKSLWSSGWGSVQRLPNRSTLVSYGLNPQSNVLFNVIDQRNRKSFELRSNDSLRAYRTTNYWKLPAPLPQPKVSSRLSGNTVVLEAEPGHANYYWSTGETTRSITVKKDGNYFVAVRFGPDGYLYSLPFEVSYFSGKRK